MSTHKCRRKIVPIDPVVLCDMFTLHEKGRTFQCTEGLPPDARLVGHDYDIQRDMHYLVFESEQWEPVDFAHPLPIQHIKFRRFSVADLLERAEAMIDGRTPLEDRWLTDYAVIRGMIE